MSLSIALFRPFRYTLSDCLQNRSISSTADEVYLLQPTKYIFYRREVYLLLASQTMVHHRHR